MPRKEYVVPSQSNAYDIWAQKDAEGWEVSLVAFDDDRRAYVFDTNEPVEHEMLVRACGNCGGPHPTEDDVLVCYAEYPSRPYRTKMHVEYKTATPQRFTEADSGIYRDPQSEKIYKVYDSIQNPGRILCKELVVDKFRKKGRFEYRGMAHRFVRHEWLLPLDEAKKFGQIYGVCCVCGRTLTDEISIANGIGPICAGKFSL